MSIKFQLNCRGTCSKKYIICSDGHKSGSHYNQPESSTKLHHTLKHSWGVVEGDLREG